MSCVQAGPPDSKSGKSWNILISETDIFVCLETHKSNGVTVHALNSMIKFYLLQELFSHYVKLEVWAALRACLTSSFDPSGAQAV